MSLSLKSKTLVIFCMLFFARQAYGKCKITDNNFIAQDVTIDMGQVVIMPNTPIGGIIKELVVPINTRTYERECTITGGGTIGRFVNAAQQVPVAGFDNVYETDVKGVGIRIFRDSGNIQTYYPHTITAELPERQQVISGFVKLIFGGGVKEEVTLAGGQFRVQLVKTASQTGSGRIAKNGRFTTYYHDGSPSIPVLTSSFKGVGTTLVNPSCEIQAGSRNIVVNLGDVANTAFNGVGSYAGERDFEIHLNCQGSNFDQYQGKIGISLDAQQHSSNLPGVLKLNESASRATGVGIQILQRVRGTEQEIRFGENINIGSTTSGLNVLSLPLRARYVQTQSATVGPGNANGYATFTIEYQ
ncbi:fimbrial protein [Pseudoalteromonas lipolytica]|uniref:Fimbrial protein n=1 Tax=Pseudoalteromonas lipolytica TaxID=570156 RepID=A0ABU8SZ04_9GAMM